MFYPVKHVIFNMNTSPAKQHKKGGENLQTAAIASLVALICLGAFFIIFSAHNRFIIWKHTNGSAFRERSPGDENKPVGLITANEHNSSIRSNRDPFSPTGILPNLDWLTGAGRRSPDEEGICQNKDVLTGEELGLSITGILKTGEGFRAIITNRKGDSFLAAPGQKMGDWTVAAISGRDVIFRSNHYIAHLELKSSSGMEWEEEKSELKTEGEKSAETPSPESPSAENEDTIDSATNKEEHVFDSIKKGRSLDFREERLFLKVTGIIKAPKGLKAILTDREGKSATVERGGNIEGWVVLSISGRTVVLQHDNALMVLKMEETDIPPDSPSQERVDIKTNNLPHLPPAEIDIKINNERKPEKFSPQKNPPNHSEAVL